MDARVTAETDDPVPPVRRLCVPTMPLVLRRLGKRTCSICPSVRDFNVIGFNPRTIHCRELTATSTTSTTATIPNTFAFPCVGLHFLDLPFLWTRFWGWSEIVRCTTKMSRDRPSVCTEKHTEHERTNDRSNRLWCHFNVCLSVCRLRVVVLFGITLNPSCVATMIFALTGD